MDELIPIFICCILPIGIVLIVFGTRAYINKKQSEVLIKAIDNGVDPDKILDAFQAPKKTPQKNQLELLNKRLQNGCIYSMLGLACITWGLILNYSGIIPENPILRTIFAMIFIPLGGLLLAVGASFLITWLATRKQVIGKKDIK